MKKTLIAIAALAATGAFAQNANPQIMATPAAATQIMSTPGADVSSLIISGQMDAGLQTFKVNTGLTTSATGSGVNSGNFGASRLAIRGTENLGGGNAANFWLEMQPNFATGAVDTNLFNRAAWLSLSGGYGEFRFGRQGTSAATVICGVIDTNGCYGSFAGGGVLFGANAFNPLIGTARTGGQIFLANPQNFSASATVGASGQSSSANNGSNTGASTATPTPGTGEATRYTRAVTYRSPASWGGLSIQLDYAFNSAPTTTNAYGGSGKTTGGMIQYANGPLVVAAGMQRADSGTASQVGAIAVTNTAVASLSNATAATNTLGIRYDLGSVILRAGYQSNSDSAGGKGTSTSINALLPLGTYRPYLAFSNANVNSVTSVVTPAGTTTNVSNALYTAKVVNLGILIGMSKRSDIYIDYAKDSGVNNAGNLAYSTSANVLQLGLRHNF